MRIGIAAILSLAAAAALAAPLEPVQAPQPGGTRGMSAPGKPTVLADADGDGLADGLAARLQELAPDAAVDVIVTFSRPGSAASAQAAVGAFLVKREYRLIAGFAASMRAAQARALARVPGVFRVEEDATAYANNQSARASFGVDRAVTDYVFTGIGVTVCIADTGIHPHEQLAGKIVGFVDLVGDIYGVFRTAPYDDNAHGTHVAVTAVGAGTAAPSATAQEQYEAALFRGVAPGASVMAAKVLDFQGQGADSGVIAGIEWCVDNGADVINLSLGVAGNGDGRSALEQAVDSAVTAGVFVAVAAGNEGDAPNTVGVPAAAKLAFTVGAAAEWAIDPGVHPQASAWQSEGLYPAPFTSRGPTKDGRIKPDIMAPGVTIVSGIGNPSFLFDPYGFGLGCGDSCYGILSGTSMATPFVAGVAALMLDANGALTPAQIAQILAETAYDWNDKPGKDNEFGHGLIDALAAVAAAADAPPVANPVPGNIAGTATVPDVGDVRIPIVVTPDMVGAPVAVTLTIDGAFVCTAKLGKFCFAGAWSPDLDAEILDPNQNPTNDYEMTSICPLAYECGLLGRQETMHFVPAAAGTLYLRVYPFEGQGGTFSYQLAHGPNAVVLSANAGPDQTVVDAGGNGAEAVTLSASASNGAIVAYHWTASGVTIADGVTTTAVFPVGTHTVTLEVVDDAANIATDTVVVKVTTATKGKGRPK